MSLFSFLAIPTGALLNRMRGDNWGKPFTSKGVIAALWGLMWGLIALSFGHGWPLSVTVALATGLGFAVWAIPGWGTYFGGAIHGRDMRHEPEIGWIDALIHPIGNPFLWGVAGLALRGLYMAPTFGVLAFLNPWALACIPACALMGPAYWIGGRIWEAGGVRLPELLTGALWAALILPIIHP